MCIPFFCIPYPTTCIPFHSLTTSVHFPSSRTASVVVPRDSQSPLVKTLTTFPGTERKEREKGGQEEERKRKKIEERYSAPRRSRLSRARKENKPFGTLCTVWFTSTSERTYRMGYRNRETGRTITESAFTVCTGV